MRKPILQQYRGAKIGGAVLLILLLGAFLRFERIGERPMHTDEAVHAVKLSELLDTGVYRYDTRDYHGPTLYYLTVPVLWVCDATRLGDMEASMLRVVPAVFGVLLIVLVVGIADGLGWRAVLYAAVLTAVSPALVYYSRYYIQEMLLVLFGFAAIVAGWRYAQTRAWWWALAVGLSIGLMHATKETAVLSWAAMAGALVLTMVWSQFRTGTTLRVRDALPPRAGLLAASTGILISAVLMSGFFRNPRGIVDSWLAYGQYLHRSGGAGLHDKPWHYYLKTLLFTRNAPGPWWSEGFVVVLALAGIGFVLKSPAPDEGNASGIRAWRLRCFLAFYTILLTLGYSLIPYKTPWCMLGFLHGMILMAGMGSATLVERLPIPCLRVLMVILFGIGTLHLGGQALRSTSSLFDADTRNPYVYAHTSSDMERLEERVEGLAGCRDIVVKVMAREYWPLPWYLRKIRYVGYWNTIPEEPESQVMITSPDLESVLDARLTKPYQKEYYGLRPEVPVLLYIENGLWTEYMETRTTRR